MKSQLKIKYLTCRVTNMIWFIFNKKEKSYTLKVAKAQMLAKMVKYLFQYNDCRKILPFSDQ